MIQLGVIGSGTEISKAIWDVAEELGREIARRGAALICGGKAGVMEAACKGVFEEAGISIGILPSIDPAEANQYVMFKIPTNLGENRNYLVIQSVQAVICISGAIGTRMEAEYALKRKVPLITIPKTGGVSQEITEEFPEQVIRAESAKEAVHKALAVIKKNF